jgi:hypothetical protein
MRRPESGAGNELGASLRNEVRTIKANVTARAVEIVARSPGAGSGDVASTDAASNSQCSIDCRIARERWRGQRSLQRVLRVDVGLVGLQRIGGVDIALVGLRRIAWMDVILPRKIC